MNKKISFIGGGNMGGAIIGGILNDGIVLNSQILVADINKSSLQNLEERYGVKTTTDNKKAAQEADILFLAVKPHLYPAVIAEIRESLRPELLIISIAAGRTIENIEKLFEHKIKLVRAMPNTPALVGEGMTALCGNQQVSAQELEEVKQICNSFGKCEVIGENLMEAVIGVSGSSPAYVYLFIEALADAAVLGGMPRKQAYGFAAQAVYGSAKMVLETGRHPGELKDMVCSPAGTTIAGVARLEKAGFRSAVIEGCAACMEKAKEMNGK